MGQEDYREVASFVDRFIRRLKWLRGVEGLCLISISLLLLFSLGLGVREIKAFFPYAPALYSLTTGAVILLLIGWTFFQCLRRISREWAALYIEKRHPNLRNNLINSLQLYPQVATEDRSQGISTTMVLALLRATRSQLQTLRVEELLSTGRIKASLRLLAILFVPVLAVVLFNPASVGETFSLLVRPLKDLPPSQTMIDVAPKGTRVIRGAAVTVGAVASGAIPKSMDLILWSDGGKVEVAEERLRMEAVGEGKFSATLRDVQKSLHYRVASGLFSSPAYTIEAVERPEIANLKITLYPPHYTGIPALTYTGGNLQAIKGSTIRLEALGTKEIGKAKILLDQGTEVPLKIDGRKLQGNLVLFQSLRYRIVVEDPLGFHNSPIPYEIEVRPDGFPTVEFLSPTSDLEVNGDEILPLEFTARDDFGIQQIALVVNLGERQEKLPVPVEAKKKLILRDHFSWDLGKLGLREKNEVSYHLEILDNDTISGPKIGTSRSLRLRLKDLKGEHQQVSEMIRDLSERMLDLLAHHLEQPPSRDAEQLKTQTTDRSLEQKMDEALKHVEQIMQRTEKDRLSDFATWSDLDALKRNLRFTKDDLLKRKEEASSLEEMSRFHDEIASEMERMSLLSEEIGKRLKAEQLATAAQDLIRSHERLLDSLDRLKSGDQALESILKELSQLAKQLESLQQALSQFASQLPDDFVNSDAMRGLSFNDMLQQLEEIRKKLMQGDLEGARQLARELFNQLASMVASLQSAQRMAMSSTMGRMQGEMSRSAGELQQILREQQEILVETEGINKKKLRERESVLKEKLARFQAQAEKELSELAELFPDEEREGAGARAARGELLDDATLNSMIKEMIGRLLKKDFPGLAEIMEMAEQELGKKRMPEQEARGRKAEASLKGLEAGLESLLEEPAEERKDGDTLALRDLSHRQGVLKERTQDLHQRLTSLFQLFPSLDPQIPKNIEEASKSMGKAQGRLSDLDSKGAVPPEREALERLSKSQQEMQNSMEQLAQRGQLGRFPVTYLFRRGRFLPSGVLVPLPGMPEFPNFDIEGGITGLDTEKFRLPGKEDYKAPRSFREEILESLKQGMPPQLKDQIESYFKNLSE